jgi:hypothetical protein
MLFKTVNEVEKYILEMKHVICDEHRTPNDLELQLFEIIKNQAMKLIVAKKSNERIAAKLVLAKDYSNVLERQLFHMEV